MKDRAIVYGMLAVFLAVIGYNIIKGLNAKDETQIREIGKDTKPLDIGLTSWKGRPINPNTITNTQALQIANRVHSYMSDIGTDQMDILKALVNLNGYSLQKVFTEFGKRKYFLTGHGQFLGLDRDLFGWFERELDDAHLLAAKRIYERANLGWS